MSASEKIRLMPERQKGVRIGILAGGGVLPRTLVQSIQDQGAQAFVVAFEGQTDPLTIRDVDHVWVRLGETRKVIRALQERDISDLVMIGAVRRPSLSELKPDIKTLEFFAKIAFSIRGDDALLRSLKSFLATEGFTVRGVQEFLPQLLAPTGVLGKIKPSKADAQDIVRGREVLNTIAPLDIGQAVIVQKGFVLGIEAAEGTDELLRRCSVLKRSGGGGVLVKLCKAGQDLDLDMPTIGPETMENIVDAGFCGLAVQAGATLIADLERVIKIADAHKIFIIGLEV